MESRSKKSPPENLRTQHLTITRFTVKGGRFLCRNRNGDQVTFSAVRRNGLGNTNSKSGFDSRELHAFLGSETILPIKFRSSLLGAGDGKTLEYLENFGLTKK